MAVTWFQFKTDTKKLLTDVTASDDLFAAACAAYVKAMICREVDHDVILRKSYWDTFTNLKRRLLGFTPTLVVGSTLDAAVKILLPVDAQREGIQNYITQQIKNAYQEVNTLNILIEKLMREAVIDLQSYIPCYRVGVESKYTTAEVTNVGNMSRGQMPDQAEFREAFALLSIPALALSTDYKSGDFVSSNGSTYMVLSTGQVSTLGSGLVTTDGSIETLGGMKFTFYYGEACLRSLLNVLPWQDRYSASYLRDGCHGNIDQPAIIFIDPEAYSFFVWPKLDTTHTISVFWTGLKFTFADGDTVPFDETVQQAVREYVLAKYYLQVEEEPRLTQQHNGAYVSLRSRAYVDCKNRQFLEFK